MCKFLTPLAQNMMHLITYTAKLGPLGFFKGYIPAFIRLAPQTILTFVFLEMLRKKWGIIVPVETAKKT